MEHSTWEATHVPNCPPPSKVPCLFLPLLGSPGGLRTGRPPGGRPGPVHKGFLGAPRLRAETSLMWGA